MGRPLKPGDSFPVTTFMFSGGRSETLPSLVGDRKGLVLIAYRGMQCGYCKAQLAEFEASLDELAERGFGALAVSMDTAERAAKTQQALTRLRVAYGLAECDARACGLFLSIARKESEMPVFCEPGLFLLRSDGTLEAGWLSSLAFPRPTAGAILQAIDLVSGVDPSLPPRGSR